MLKNYQLANLRAYWIKKEIRDDLKRLIAEKKPSWIRPESGYWEDEKAFWWSDRSTMNIPHPQTPVEFVEIFESRGDLAAAELAIKILRGEISLSGKFFGQVAENTCPKCDGFLASWPGNREDLITRYACSACGYNHRSGLGESREWMEQVSTRPCNCGAECGAMAPHEPTPYCG